MWLIPSDGQDRDEKAANQTVCSKVDQLLDPALSLVCLRDWILPCSQELSDKVKPEKSVESQDTESNLGGDGHDIPFVPHLVPLPRHLDSNIKADGGCEAEQEQCIENIALVQRELVNIFCLSLIIT